MLGQMLKSWNFSLYLFFSCILNLLIILTTKAYNICSNPCSPTAEKTSSSVSLSAGLIDQVEHAPREKVDIEDLISNWGQGTDDTWPYCFTDSRGKRYVGVISNSGQGTDDTWLYCFTDGWGKRYVEKDLHVLYFPDSLIMIIPTLFMHTSAFDSTVKELSWTKSLGYISIILKFTNFKSLATSVVT